MLKAGIFLDMENLNRCGGWGMRYHIIKELVKAQGGSLLRCNAYIAIDEEREMVNTEYYKKKEEYRNALRREGFHVVLKPVKRFYDDDGQIFLKANADLDLAVDAILQSENLDYILIGTGDGDFIRLVRALQNRGKRVDLLAFSYASKELRHEVDAFFSGYLVPDLLPSEDADSSRCRGVMHGVNIEKGYGFITVRTGLGFGEVRDDVFCHIRDFTCNGEQISNERFSNLKTNEAIIEFDLVEQENGRAKAVNAEEFTPQIRTSID